MRRLGLVVSRAAVHAVVTHRGRLVWLAARRLDAPGDVCDALGELAAECPAGMRRARVALETDVCQLKVLTGMPPLRRGALRRMVALQAERWFLRNGGALVTDAVRVATGAVVAAAVERNLVRAIADGLAEAGLRLTGIGPLALARAAVLPDGAHERRVGGLHETLEIERGALKRVRRAAVPEAASASDTAGARDDALTAATRAQPLDLVPPEVAVRRDGRRRRLGAAFIAAGLALGLAAGGIWFVRVTNALEATRTRLAELEPVVAPAERIRADIAQADEILRALAAADARRAHDLRLLAALTGALSDSVSLVSLRRERTDTVTVVGFAPSAARVVAVLARVSGMRDPALAGPVTRERMPASGASGAAAPVRERFTIRFVWHAADVP